jgi:hypothetical protein
MIRNEKELRKFIKQEKWANPNSNESQWLLSVLRQWDAQRTGFWRTQLPCIYGLDPLYSLGLLYISISPALDGEAVPFSFLFMTNERRSLLAHQSVMARKQFGLAQVEQSERDELVRLLDKYGVPDGYVKETK